MAKHTGFWMGLALVCTFWIPKMPALLTLGVTVAAVQPRLTPLPLAATFTVKPKVSSAGLERVPLALRVTFEKEGGSNQSRQRGQGTQRSRCGQYTVHLTTTPLSEEKGTRSVPATHLGHQNGIPHQMRA